VAQVEENLHLMRLPIRRQRPSLLLPWVLLLAACGEEDAGSSRWVGKTYLLDIPAANWAEPPGIGGDIGDFVPQFLIGVESAAAGNLTITLGTAAGGAQDPCTPTTQVTTSAAEYPRTQIIAARFPMRIVDAVNAITVNTTIHDLTLTNVLPAESAAKDGELKATADIAEIYPLFTKIPNATKESVCSQLAAFGAPCAICAANAQPYCLTIKAVELASTAAPTPVAPILASTLPVSCSP
jgi:hypothetical protein